MKTQVHNKLLKSLLFLGFFSFSLAGMAQGEFITTWNTEGAGASTYSGETTITIPITVGAYDVDINGDGTYEHENQTGTQIIDVGSVNNNVTVHIRPNAANNPSGQLRIYFNSPDADTNQRGKLSQIVKWGTIVWDPTMIHAFSGCSNLTIASDAGAPDLSVTTNMQATFRGCTSLTTGNFDAWDTSNLIVINTLFYACPFFNGDLSGWDVSNVTQMQWMFTGAFVFNSDISGWDVSKVTTMQQAFENATSFNQDLGDWDVSSLVTASLMFSGATSFSSENYDKLLIGWSSLPTLQTAVPFGAPPVAYCAGLGGRVTLEAAPYNWAITGDTGESTDCNRWSGATDTDWDTTTNWSKGSVPTGTSTIVIPAVANVPVSFSNIEGSTLTLLPGTALTVGAQVVIAGDITLNSGSSLIASTQNFAAALTVTYKRNLPTDNWYLVASPVTGETYSDFVNNNSIALGSGTGTTQNIGFAPYNTTTDAWDYYTAGQFDGVGGDDLLTAMPDVHGFSIKLGKPGSLSFTGRFLTDNRQISTMDVSGNGFNLAGNPYASYVALNSNAGFSNLLTTNGSLGPDRLEEDTAWFWNQSLNGGLGAYTQVNQGSAAYYVAPGQGFFVQAKAAAAFLFTEPMQSHQAADVFTRNARPEITLNISNGTNTSATEIYYISGKTLGFDNGYDSSIFGGVANEFKVYTHLLSDNGQVKNLGIQSLPDANHESMVIPVGINAVSGSELVFTAESVNIPNGLDVILEDRQEGIFTNLSAVGATYAITVSDTMSGAGRFYLHTTTQESLSTVSETLTGVSAFTANRATLRVTGITRGTASLALYNLLGQSVLSTQFEGNLVNDISLPTTLKSGVYVVAIETALGKLNKKIILE